MKTETRLVHTLSLDEFYALLVRLYSLTPSQAREWVQGWAEWKNARNGETIVAEAEEVEFELYDEWLAEVAPPHRDYIEGGIDAILCDAVNRSILPEGLYLIPYAW